MKQDLQTMEALIAIEVDPYLTQIGDFTVRLFTGDRFCCDTPDGFKLLTARQVRRKFGTFL